ncbi:MAG TPA: response regulator [Bdellovibrio sp.]|nr:response regulator [Bdellovibrio sp.]
MSSTEFSPEVAAFLKDEKVLIVEPSVSFAQTLIELLKEAHVPEKNIFHVRGFEEATKIIETKKPKVLITEYAVGATNGISLVPLQMKNHDESVKIATLITHDSTSTTIAEAAEEHVDAYILKPFSIGDFSARLNKVIQSKLMPSPFEQKIKSGKALLRNSEFEMAALEFKEAIKIREKSPLGYYYVGQALHLQRSIPEAASEYRKGLNINPLHYKCLLGEFDSHFEQADYSGAYGVAKKIAAYFPISPKRMGNIFISLVFSHHLEDITSYFQMYRDLDFRPAELTKIFGAALSTAGKYNLKRNQITKGNECFAMGVAVVGPDVIYLETVIRELLKVKAADMARNYLSLFPSVEVGKKVYSQMSFLIDIQTVGDADFIVEKGKKLVAQNFADRDSYRQLVQYLVDLNKIVLAEDIAAKAVRDFPELREEVYAMIVE